MPGKTLVRLGLGFIVLAAAVYFYAGHWLRTRIFVPLDVPVTFDSPQIKSPPFEINLRESYYVSLLLEDRSDDWRPDASCSGWSFLVSEWRAYRLAKSGRRELWSNSKNPHQFYEYWQFTATPGQYQLEWSLSAPAPCLNSRHPRLWVRTFPDRYEGGIGYLQTCCIFLGGTGAGLLLFAPFRAQMHHFATGQALRMFPDMVLPNALPIRKRVPLPPIQILPHWGLLCGIVAILGILTFSIIPQWVPPMGLWVSWAPQESVVGAKSLSPDTLQVYVAQTGVVPRFLVNGREVDRRALRVELPEQLSRHAERNVYFEADKDVLWKDVVYAIDAIQSSGAKVIWITPKIREEWHHKHNLASGPGKSRNR